jgi:putative peptidoglycan lipid II flippase
VSGVVMGILNAQQHFLLPALAPVIYNLAIILAALFLGERWGVRGLTAGVVIGAAGHLLVQLPGLIQKRMRYRPLLLWREATLREVGRLMAPRVLGLAAVQINFVVTAMLASGLSPGSLTALNYGWIIMLLPQGIIAQSIATALFPTLATLVAQGQRDEMRRVFETTLRNMLFLTLPASVGLIILRVPIVRLLLEWGEFNETSTQMTAWALGFFALGLVGHALVEIITRAFYALKNTKTPVLVAVITMLVNIGLSMALMNLFAQLSWPPHGGLALANSVAVMLEMAILLALLRPLLGGWADTRLRSSVVKMSVALLGTVAALMGVMSLLPADSKWLGGVVGIVVGGAVYGGLAYMLRVPEVDFVRQRLRRR